MEIVEVIHGALQGFSNFIIGFFEVLGANLSRETAEALTGFFLLCLCLRILDGGGPKFKIRREKRRDEDEEEYVVVRKR